MEAAVEEAVSWALCSFSRISKDKLWMLFMIFIWDVLGVLWFSFGICQVSFLSFPVFFSVLACFWGDLSRAPCRFSRVFVKNFLAFPLSGDVFIYIPLLGDLSERGNSMQMISWYPRS